MLRSGPPGFMKLARKLIIALVAAMLAVFTARGLLRVRHETRVIEGEYRERQRLVVLALRAPLARLGRAGGPGAVDAALREATAELGESRLRWVAPGAAAPPLSHPARLRDGATVAITTLTASTSSRTPRSRSTTRPLA